MENLTLVWSYDLTLALVFYKLAVVFKQFSFAHLLHENEQCTCSHVSKLKQFCDPLTMTETSSFCKPSMHVYTMNMKIIQHRDLCVTLFHGFNHIPCSPQILQKQYQHWCRHSNNLSYYWIWSSYSSESMQLVLIFMAPILLLSKPQQKLTNMASNSQGSLSLTFQQLRTKLNGYYSIFFVQA